MKTTRKPTLYYFLFGFCLLGVLVNIADRTWLPILLWLPLSAVFWILMRKRQTINKAEKIIIQAESEKKSNLLYAYKNEYIKALNDKTNSEEINLDTEQLLSSLSVSEKEAEIADEQARKLCLDEIVQNSISNGMLSPENYEYIITTAKRLNVKLSFDDMTSAYLEKLRQYWKIENEDLQTQTVSISLQNSEVCYFQTECRWLEHRTLTKSVSYSGVMGSFKIIKGVRYRVGNLKLQKITVDKLVEIDSGNLFITNKRIIFMGAKKNSNIKYQNILSIVPYSDGVGIEKDSGKSPTLICDNPDMAARILSRLNN